MSEAFRHDLDRHVSIELCVLSPIDFAHTACAELGGDAIDADGLADHFLLAGTRRRSSPKKFSRKTTWFCACCASGVSPGTKAAMRLPSGAISKLFTRPRFASRFSDHTRGFSATNESPFAVYAATMIRLSSLRKNSSRPLGDQTGKRPPLFDI